jgi:hypothetical protein
LKFALDIFQDHNGALYLTWIYVPYRPNGEIFLLSVTFRSCPCNRFELWYEDADPEAETCGIVNLFPHSCPTRLFEFDNALQIKLGDPQLHLHKLEVQLAGHESTGHSMKIIARIMGQLFTATARKHNHSWGMDDWEWSLSDMIVAFAFHTLTRRFTCFPRYFPVELDTDTGTEMESDSEGEE